MLFACPDVNYFCLYLPHGIRPLNFDVNEVLRGSFHVEVFYHIEINTFICFLFVAQITPHEQVHFNKHLPNYFIRQQLQ